ncbi:tetratricopeptide repeat protein [Aromatoleum diolicum]|uniref:Tetratricopeptide repeat protein n=1 Tax=Aromatoleum diolicum TaxID=75796 RepID=A0ABX1QCI6_9RHOO|nr:tetratricopeptide repeat protein [Aromatoleum diolicum]NMG75735.1 tetratricopeptide repeat protein [Aromatoleum diolicum]
MTWETPAPPTPAQARLRFADVFTMPTRTPSLNATNSGELRTRFEQGVMMLHMKQYEFALTAFHQVLALEPKLPEAHVNMGFALLGLKQWRGARDFFESAIELRRDQMNAYYGLAIALEGQGDMPGAMGAMQTYLHRAAADDPFRARAESALWEWRTGTTRPESAKLEQAHGEQ